MKKVLFIILALSVFSCSFFEKKEAPKAEVKKSTHDSVTFAVKLAQTQMNVLRSNQIAAAKLSEDFNKQIMAFPEVKKLYDDYRKQITTLDQKDFWDKVMGLHGDHNIVPDSIYLLRLEGDSLRVGYKR